MEIMDRLSQLKYLIEFVVDTLHIFNSGKIIMQGGLRSELFYASIPTLFPCFLLICYPYILLCFSSCI